jgi:hypothetical protein
MTSTCGAVRRELLSVTGPRDHDASLAEAQAHMEQCASCRRFMAEMHAISEATRAASGGDTAPAEVRERLFARIAAARTGARRQKVVRAAQLSIAAAAVVAAIAVLDIGRSREVPSAFVSAITQEHAAAVSGDRHESTRCRRAAAMACGAIAVRGFRTGTGGRAARWRAHLSHLARPWCGRGVWQSAAKWSPTSSFRRRRAGCRNPGRLRYAHAAGYRAVMWSEMGLMHAMVGALPQPTLERLARDCIKQAARSGRMAFSSSRTPYS